MRRHALLAAVNTDIGTGEDGTQTGYRTAADPWPYHPKLGAIREIA